MSFLGLFQFHAPFLPWVLLGFSVLLGNSPSVDLMGIGVGHLYYFFDDVFPLTRGGKGRRPLRCPRRLARLVDGAPHAAWEGAGFVLHAQPPEAEAPRAPAAEAPPDPGVEPDDGVGR